MPAKKPCCASHAGSCIADPRPSTPGPYCPSAGSGRATSGRPAASAASTPQTSPTFWCSWRRGGAARQRVATQRQQRSSRSGSPPRSSTASSSWKQQPRQQQWQGAAPRRRRRRRQQQWKSRPRWQLSELYNMFSCLLSICITLQKDGCSVSLPLSTQSIAAHWQSCCN